MAMSERRYQDIVRSAALGRQARTETAQERYERFLQLRRGGYSIQEAAWELGITRRHADRYVARFRNESAKATEPVSLHPEGGPKPPLDTFEVQDEPLFDLLESA